MALKISMKPGERIVVNGAVISTGDRRTSLVFHNRANILRGRDLIEEEQATTPAARLCYLIQRGYMGDAGMIPWQDVVAALDAFRKVAPPDLYEAVHKEIHMQELMEPYSVIAMLRPALAAEKAAHVAAAPIPLP